MNMFIKWIIKWISWGRRGSKSEEIWKKKKKEMIVWESLILGILEGGDILL